METLGTGICFTRPIVLAQFMDPSHSSPQGLVACILLGFFHLCADHNDPLLSVAIAQGQLVGVF